MNRRGLLMSLSHSCVVSDVTQWQVFQTFPSSFFDGSYKALLFIQSLDMGDPKWIKPSHNLQFYSKKLYTPWCIKHAQNTWCLPLSLSCSFLPCQQHQQLCPSRGSAMLMLVDYPPDLCGFLRFTLHSGVSFQNTAFSRRTTAFSLSLSSCIGQCLE